MFGSPTLRLALAGLTLSACALCVRPALAGGSESAPLAADAVKRGTSGQAYYWRRGTC